MEMLKLLEYLQKIHVTIGMIVSKQCSVSTLEHSICFTITERCKK